MRNFVTETVHGKAIQLELEPTRTLYTIVFSIGQRTLDK